MTVQTATNDIPSETSKYFAWLTWPTRETVKIALHYFFSTLIFLATLAAIATTLYIGLLAIAPVAAGLSLTAPALIAVAIGAGIFVLGLAVALRFIQIHLDLYKGMKLRMMSQ